MREKVFIPIGPFAPDAQDYDSPALDDALNLLPIFDSYRSLSRFEVQTEQESNYPVTGCHAHLVTDRQARQRGAPLGDGSEEVGADWENYGDVPEGDDDNAANRVNEASADDTNGIEIRGVSAYGDNIAKFNLTQLQTPTETTQHLLRLRFRLYEFDNLVTWTITCELRNGSDDSLVATLQRTEADTVDEDGFQTIEHELTGPEQALIIDYAALEIWISFTATTVASPVADIKAREIYAGAGDWTEVGEGETLLEAIQEMDDDKYAETAETDQQRILEVAVDPVIQPDSQATPNTWEGIVRARCHETNGDNGASMDVILFNGVTEVKRATHAVPQAAGWSSYKVTVDNNELNDWDGSTKDWDDVNWDDFRVALEASSAAPAVAAINIYNPDSVHFEEANSWTPVGGTKTAVVAEGSGKNTYMESGTNLPITGTRLIYNYPNGITWAVEDTVRIVCQAGGFGGSGELRVSLTHESDSSDFIQRKNTVTNPNSNDVDMGFTLTEASKQEIIDRGFAGVRIKVEHRDKFNDPDFYTRYFWIYFEVETAAGPYQLLVDSVSMAAPTEVGVGVSQTQLTIPSLASSAPGDRVILYAGTQDKIYEVAESGFIDRSKAGGYGAGENQGPWRFASWGQAVIATNGSDPVQWQPEYGVPFEDLFTSDDKPTARHVGVVKDFAKFANVLITGEEADFNEAVAWWAENNNPRSVKRIDLETQSDFQPIYSRAGEITAYRGGEASTLLKRNSIFRMSYVGPPFIFDLDLVADQEGTAYPESVVQIERDLIFFGNGGFRLLPWGDRPRPIGDNVVTKMFVDTVMEDRALALVQSEDRRELENAIVGTYDPWTRLAIWLYRRKEGSAYKNVAGLCYNPFEDRWAPLDLSDRHGYSQIVATPNIQSPQRALTRNINAFSWDGAKIYRERAVGSTSYPMRLATKALSAAFFGAKRGMHLTIHGLRMLMSRDDSDEVLARFRLPAGRRYIQAAEDPWFTDTVTTEEILDATDAANDDGWLMLGNPVSGAYYRLVFEFDPIEDGAVREFIGYEVDLELAGAR